jgi:hypothetical protein
MGIAREIFFCWGPLLQFCVDKSMTKAVRMALRYFSTVAQFIGACSISMNPTLLYT